MRHDEITCSHTYTVFGEINFDNFTSKLQSQVVPTYVQADQFFIVFRFSYWSEMHFYFEMHKTTDFHSNLLISWELMTEGCQGIPMRCAHTLARYGHFLVFSICKFTSVVF